jgi:hypothetical protein
LFESSYNGHLNNSFSPLYFALKMERGDADRQWGEAKNKRPPLKGSLPFLTKL